MTGNLYTPIKVLLAGTGGYGQYYLRTLLEEFPEGKVEVVGVVDPFCNKTPLYHEIRDRCIKDYPTIRKFYEEVDHCDLAVISSPIHFHVPHAIYAMEHGSHVLCDKPLTADPVEVEELIKTRDKYGKKVWVGFQWSFSKAIQELKADLLSGKYGRIRQMKSICFWPRDYAYYNRNDWAGRIMSRGGRWLLDSPANNAMAHFIHNMLYLAGDRIELAAKPLEVEAKTYRAYPIENYDTIACRILAERDIEMLFYGSHVTENELGPLFEIICDDVMIKYENRETGIVALQEDVVVKRYGAPDDDHQFSKLFYAIENLFNEKNILCGPEAAGEHVSCVNMIQENMQIENFPKDIIVNLSIENRIYIRKLGHRLYNCYRHNVLPDDHKKVQ